MTQHIGGVGRTALAGSVVVVSALSTVVGIGIGTSVGAAGRGQTATSTDVVVKAQRFEVVDAAGTVRARFGLREGEREPALELLDANGVVQASLALGEFPRPDDERLRLRRSEARRLVVTEEPLRAVLRLGTQTTSRDPSVNVPVVDEPSVELGVGSTLRVLRMRDHMGDERVELRVARYDNDNSFRDAADLAQPSLRLKSPSATAGEDVALELGVEPVSPLRPSDRRPPIEGRLFDVPAPYIVLFGTGERPVFFLSSWAGGSEPGGGRATEVETPSLDLWSTDGTSLFSLPREKGKDEAKE
jgi:hypothetical protein